MPHSVSPEALASETDDTMKEVENQTDENDDTQNSDVDEDMTMADIEVQHKSEDSSAVKPEVKLEDLFADMESDEEFPSSNNDNVASSSPPSSTSPM